jgi:DNA-directed RNA polymerase specialized sigma24 family protein
MDDRPFPPAQGDEAELFRTFNRDLQRRVSSIVRVSSPQVVEDACSFAWAQFMQHQPDRERSWRSWLVRVAERESWRLEAQVAEGHLPITGDGEVPWEPADRVDQYEVRDGLDDVVSTLERLPDRLRRIAMLRALGLQHREIGDITGDSPVRVAQLVSRANVKICEVVAERDIQSPDVSPRARRLWELEHEQPQWLTDRIGKVPVVNRKTAGQTVSRRAWRRAAIAIDDYRKSIGARRFDNAALQPPEPGTGLRHQHDVAERAIAELAHVRGRALGRGLGD